MQLVDEQLNGWMGKPVWSLDRRWIFLGGDVPPTDGLWAIRADERTLHLVDKGLHVPSPLAVLS